MAKIFGKHAKIASSDWVAYTPTFSAGWGTPTQIAFYSRRVGDSLEIKGSFLAGTVAASLASVTLGFNGINGNVTVDTSKFANFSPNSELVGVGNNAAASSSEMTVLAVQATPGSLFFSTTGAPPLAPANCNAVVASNNTVSFFARVPISGWKSSDIVAVTP